jgi:hypothetical protein
MAQRFESFEEFWPFYVREHSKKGTRALHFAGTTAALALTAAAVLKRRPGLFLLALAAGYGPAWVGHFFVQGNRPATFSYPLWSLRADLIMWWKIATDTMDEEVERATAATGAEDGNGVRDEGRSPPAPSAATSKHGREVLN